MSIIAHSLFGTSDTKDRSHLREKRKRKRDTDKHKYKHTEVYTRINHNVADKVDFLAFKLPCRRGNLLLPVFICGKAKKTLARQGNGKTVRTCVIYVDQ